MSEYRAIFDARGSHYNLANHRFPLARAEEAATLLDHMAFSPRRERWLDLAAGGGYLAERARAGRTSHAAVACDASLPFVRESHGYRGRTVAEYGALPFGDASFSAAGCLAALHHADDPSEVAGEMLRVVAPGGRAAAGDVAPGSAPAAFLNGFVDGHTDTGHHGRFVSVETLRGAFADAGGRRLRSEEREIPWRFPSRDAAVAFCRELFGLRPATADAEIAEALEPLGIANTADGTTIPWRMIFVSAER